MNLNERNCKILSEYQPEVYKGILEPPKMKFDNINVLFGKNENDVIDTILIQKDGKMYRDDAGASTDDFVNRINPDLHTIIVLGFGMGGHIEAAVKKYPDKKFIVIEPDKRVIGHALHLKDLEFVFRHCEIWTDENVQTIKSKMWAMLTHPLCRGIQVVPYILLYDDFIMNFYAEMQNLLNDFAVMTNTKRCLVDKWYKNRIENAKRPSVNAKSLIGKFKDIPALLVGAGPSLQSQIETIKNLQGKAIIIAASTAIQILVSNNITPTFMVAIDQDPITSGGLHENLKADVPLIFDGQVAQNSLNYKGKHFQVVLNVNQYTKKLIPDLPVIESGPSVGNATLDLLHKFGCSPILIVGFDLSYTYDKLYCDGTEFNQDMSKTQTMMLTDNKGNLCKTEPSFLSMRNWFTEYANRVKPTVFNCTERGLPMPGIENKSLDDFTFDKEYDFKKMIDEEYFKDGKPDYAQYDYKAENGKMIDELKSIRDTIEKTNTATAEQKQLFSWIMIEEFSHVMIYLEEILSEERIRKGMDKGKSIDIFNKRRTEVLIDSIDKLIEMLS